MASLEKHNQPLDSRLAKHLLRRACFHYSQELLNESEGKTPEQVLSILKKNKELEKLGIFQENDKVITIIEWPEIIKKTIANRVEITFYHQEDQKSRKLRIKGFGKWKKFKLNAI